MSDLVDAIARQSFTYRRNSRELVCDFCGEVVDRGQGDAFLYKLCGAAAMGRAVEHMVSRGRPAKFWDASYFCDLVGGDVRLWLARNSPIREIGR